MKLPYKSPIIFIFSLFLITGSLFAQDPISDEETFEARYERNIKKSRINGTYIPVDMEDAIVELSQLSDEKALAKFKNADEDMVSRKLHFGLGRWMIYNWNFYEGSRYSHYLKNLGLSHPDDMARFTIVCLHRNLNGLPFEIQALVAKLNLERKKMMEKGKEDAVLIKEEKRIRVKKN